MRILGPKDYYDSAMGLGSDETRIYIRPKVEWLEKRIQDGLVKSKNRRDMIPKYVDNTEFMSLDKILHDAFWKDIHPSGIPEIRVEWDYPKSIFYSHPDERVYFGSVFFCGTVYKFAYLHHIEGRGRLPDSPSYSCSIEVFYSYEALMEFINKLPKAKLVPRYRNWFASGKQEATWDEQVHERLRTFFGQVSIPPMGKEICVARMSGAVIKNPILKDLQFQKVMNPVTAFQTVEQYLYGVLGESEKEVVNISDKDRIAQHGFDKHSFRKMPTKKR